MNPTRQGEIESLRKLNLKDLKRRYGEAVRRIIALFESRASVSVHSPASTERITFINSVGAQK